MGVQMWGIVCSILLLPVNVFCSSWLFREALILTGMSFREFVSRYTGKVHVFNRHRRRNQQRFLGRFFREHSSDPQRSISLTRIYGFATIPGLAALILAWCAAVKAEWGKFVLIGDLILVAVNAGLLIWGRIYRRNRRDEGAKNTSERKIRGEEIFVYSLVGALFFGVLLFFMLGISGILQNPSPTVENPSTSPNLQPSSAILLREDVITVLTEREYETANLPPTYGTLEEPKLEHTAVGRKGATGFDFYGYTDRETADAVYGRIVAEFSDSNEISVPGGKGITAVADVVSYCVIRREDTVIYAYTPDSLEEIYEILGAIGYLK